LPNISILSLYFSYKRQKFSKNNIYYRSRVVPVYTKHINLRYWLGLRVFLSLHSTIFQLYLGS
jgi:hypothetical protein